MARKQTPDESFEPMSKRRRGFPSETGVKRGNRSVRDASRTAATTAAAFDGAGRADYFRE